MKKHRARRKHTIWLSKKVVYGGVRVFVNNDKMISEMCKDSETAIRLAECIVEELQ